MSTYYIFSYTENEIESRQNGTKNHILRWALLRLPEFRRTKQYMILKKAVPVDM
jgi:hypothetical protein